MKILKTTSGTSPRTDLSNNIIYSQSQSHATVPLKVYLQEAFPTWYPDSNSKFILNLKLITLKYAETIFCVTLEQQNNLFLVDYVSDSSQKIFLSSVFFKNCWRRLSNLFHIFANYAECICARSQNMRNETVRILPNIQIETAGIHNICGWNFVNSQNAQTYFTLSYLGKIRN
jgi:hypothetical protein